MKLEKFKKYNKLNTIMVVLIVVALFGGAYITYKSYATYTEEKTFDVIQGRVPDFTNYEMIVTTTNGTATYSGSVTNGGAKVTVTEPSSDYTILYGTTEGTYDLEEMPTYTDVGEYTVYYKVKAKGYKKQEGSFTITINKDTASVTARSLTYTSEAQELVAVSSAGGTIYYKLGSSGTYSKTIPTATDAGTYTVYYKVVGDSNNNDVAENSISVTISKASAIYTAPTAKSLTWSGSSQTLINAGSSSTGTMYYRLSTSSTWSTSLPTATDAGTYTVYYKVTSSNSNYSDLSQKSISVTISGYNLVTYIKTKASSDTTNLAYDGTSDNNLRYIGANPNNYICFDTSCTAGKWRIIGVMNNMTVSGSSTSGSSTSGSSTKQRLVKVIRADSVGSVAWDSSDVNDWSTSSLQTSLNSGDLYTSYIKSINSKFETVVWNLGGWSSAQITTSAFYTYERGKTVYDSSRPTTWEGKIGLIYPSDYGYATSGGTIGRSVCLGYNLYDWDSYSQCYSNDYLFDSSAFQWTISPNSTTGSVFRVGTSGRVNGNRAKLTSLVRPAGYLVSSLTIKSGSGTSSSPYIVG